MSKQKGQVNRRRHVPQRTCIACRRVASKRELIRIVKTPDQGVQIDLTGKRSGRGAYLCRSETCWQKALRGSLLNRTLKTTLQAEETAALAAFAARLAAESDNDPATADYLDRSMVNPTQPAKQNKKPTSVEPSE